MSMLTSTRMVERITNEGGIIAPEPRVTPAAALEPARVPIFSANAAVLAPGVTLTGEIDAVAFRGNPVQVRVTGESNEPC